MNGIEEITLAIGIGLVVASFLLNTGRALKVIEVCSEYLVLLNNKAMSKKKQYCKLIYREIHETMSKIFKTCYVNRDNTNAITCGRKLLVIYYECGEKIREGMLSIDLAQIYVRQSKFAEAKELYERAIILAKETGAKQGEADAYGGLATVFQSVGEYVKAKEYYEKAIPITLEIGDRAGEATVYGNLALVFKSLGKCAKAKEYNEKALAIRKETGDRKGEAICYGNLGTVFQSLGEYLKAKRYYEKALPIRKETGDRAGEATDYGNLGTAFLSLGEYVKAQDYLEKALAITIETGDRAGEASCYGNLGAVFQFLGKYIKAKEYYEKALAFRLEIGDRAGEAVVCGNLGTIYQYLCEYVKAKEYHERALAITIETGDRAGEATCRGNLGKVFSSFGEYVKAKEYHEKGLSIRLEIGDRPGETKHYEDLGNVFKSLGEYVKAQECLEKALSITKEIGDREGVAACCENLGAMLESLGEYVKAKEYHERALAIIMETGDREGLAACYGSLGTVLRSLGEFEKSKEYLDKALAISIEIGDREREACCYNKQGNLFQSLGDIVKAKEYYEKALSTMIEIGDRGGEAAAYGNLGGVFQSFGEYNTAEEYLEKALSISKQIRHGETELGCYRFLTLTKLAQENFEEASSFLIRSIEKCEALRDFNEESDEIKISFADMHVFPYQQLSVLFCHTGNPNNALYVVELGRARALADLIATQYCAEKHMTASPQSWIGIENVMKKERNCTCLYISYHAQKVFLWILKTSGVVALRQTTVDKSTLHTKLAQPTSDLNEFFAVMAKSFRSFGILPEEVCEDRSLNGAEPNADSCQAESLAPLHRGKDEGDLELILTLFHKMIIDPISDLLEEPEIIIVPDRNLYRVPFPALRDEKGKFLSETFRIRVVPSLTTLKLIQNSPVDYHSQTGALIVGDPKVGRVRFQRRVKTFSSLPGARKEAEMIGRLLGVQPLVGEHATKQAVLQRINSVSLVHFAAHGNAERGEIALAPILGSATRIPQEDDYLLKMADISQVQLRAKLVVLSCCHSGRGQIRAEGVVGIARAFLGSGARSVLVALWALEDSATEHLMSRFYEHLVRGESASESLHEAMRWMRDNGFTKVSEWASLMLIGDNVTCVFGK